MGEDYIDRFGGKKDYSGSDYSIRRYIPLTMGIISFIIFAVYLFSALNGRGAIMSIIIFVPFFSIIGLILSFITRKTKDNYYRLWLFGVISCALSFILFNLIYFATWMALAQR